MTSKSKRYCSVPQCKNYKTEALSIHFFPRDPILAKKWATALRIGKPVSKRMSVCSEHFLPNDFHPLRQYSSKRYLKNGVVPSKKIPTRQYDQPQPSTSSARKSRAKKRSEKRELLPTVNIDSLSDEETRNAEDEETKDAEEEETRDAEDEETRNKEQVEKARMDFLEDVRQMDVPEQETRHTDKSIQVNLYESENSIRFHEYLLTSNFKLSVYTGINIELFNTVEKLVKNTLKLFSTLNASNIDRKICIILTKLKLDLSFRALGIMYELSTATVQNYFHNYIYVLYYALKPAIYFPTKEENLRNLPSCFKEYKNVRIVIDAIEVPVQKSSSLDCRIRSYSHYKKAHTAKFLISVNPAGLLVHVSSAYGGRVSDKAIFNAEKIIDFLDPYHDAIMVGKGFLNGKKCAEKGIQLIRPPFLRNMQLLSREALKTASITKPRVHVERSIQRIKNFKIFSNKLESLLVPHLTEMMTIVCALVNLSKPILNDDKFTELCMLSKTD